MEFNYFSLLGVKKNGVWQAFVLALTLAEDEATTHASSSSSSVTLDPAIFCKKINRDSISGRTFQSIMH
jgi:hypothetical protein